MTEFIYFDDYFLKGYWEVDWIKELFFDNESRYVYYTDNSIDYSNKLFIVINYHFINTFVSFFNNKLQKHKFYLIVISDEGYTFPQQIYNIPNILYIFNSQKPTHIHINNMIHITPGYKYRMFQDKISLDVQRNTKREYIWSFCGQVTKSGRKEALDKISHIKPYYVHGNSAFGSSDCLDVVSYRNILENTKIVPCLLGFVNIETSRIYEALECGCIPIVLKYNSKFDKKNDYFKTFMGEHPLPTINNTDELNDKINELLTNDFEKKRVEIYTWYNNFKDSLKLQIKSVTNQMV